MGEYIYKTLSAAKFWLEEGWYTAEDLQKILDMKKLQDKHLRKVMEALSEEKK